MEEDVAYFKLNSTVEGVLTRTVAEIAALNQSTANEGFKWLPERTCFNDSQLQAKAERQCRM